MAVSQRIVQWINGMGYGTFILEFDQETVIVDLQHGAKDARIRIFDKVGIHVKALMGVDDKSNSIVVLENSFVG